MKTYCYKGKREFLEDTATSDAFIAQKLRHFYMGSPLMFVSSGGTRDDDVTRVVKRNKTRRISNKFKSRSLDPTDFRQKTRVITWR